MILHIKIACYKKGNENLLEEDSDMWLPMAILWSSVIAIKNNGGGTDFMGENKAVFYLTNNDHYVADIEYDDAISRWEEFMNKLPYE